MERIEMPEGVTYLQAKRYAGNIMSTNPSVSSVRVLIAKETKSSPVKFIIETTTFPKNVVNKFAKE